MLQRLIPTEIESSDISHIIEERTIPNPVVNSVNRTVDEEIIDGTLYVVSTPIGNLSDITYRAVSLLERVAFIAAEDTRHTRKLLSAYDIHTPLLSYTPFNRRERIPRIIRRLEQGEAAALVTDAGTPLVSDPGSMLVKAVLDAGLSVTPIPGASALLAALVVSGFMTDQFVFEGFLPVKKGRRTRLDALANEPRTTILYESPHRLLKLLGELQDVIGDRHVIVARELTKKFEEVKRGAVEDIKVWFESHKPRGEFVVVIGKM